MIMAAALICRRVYRAVLLIKILPALTFDDALPSARSSGEDAVSSPTSIPGGGCSLKIKGDKLPLHLKGQGVTRQSERYGRECDGRGGRIVTYLYPPLRLAPSLPAGPFINENKLYFGQFSDMTHLIDNA